MVVKSPSDSDAAHGSNNDIALAEDAPKRETHVRPDGRSLNYTWPLSDMVYVRVHAFAVYTTDHGRLQQSRCRRLGTEEQSKEAVQFAVLIEERKRICDRRL
jgi:hypothetical protein